MIAKEAIAAGKNSCITYILPTCIIRKEIEKTAETHKPIRLAIAYALGAGEPTVYFVLYNTKNIVDIIDSIRRIFTGLFIVIYQLIYDSVMQHAAHSITNIPNIARKLLCEEGYRMSDRKNNADNNDKIIMATESSSVKEQLRNFIIAQMINATVEIQADAFERCDDFGFSADSVFFGMNMNIVNIHMQVNNSKYFEIYGKTDCSEKYAIGVSNANKKLRIYVAADNAERINAEK